MTSNKSTDKQKVSGDGDSPFRAVGQGMQAKKNSVPLEELASNRSLLWDATKRS